LQNPIGIRQKNGVGPQHTSKKTGSLTQSKPNP
jgi:hypothetical protein